MKILSRLFAIASVSLCTLIVPALQAAPVSPAGDWDFVMSGKQRGVAFLTFDPGFTLFGSELFRPAPPANSSSSSSGESRNDGTDASRTGPTTSTNSATSTTNVYGGATIDGFWTYNQAGRLVGSFNEIHVTLENVTRLQTNVVDGTNMVTSVTQLEYVNHTNGVSFRGTVSGNRMTLNVYTDRGLVTFTGVRMATLPDYSGSYFGVATKDRPYVEFFSSTPSGLGSGGYTIANGIGPGYFFNGAMMVSKQKQVAIYTLTESGTLTVLTGPYKTNRFTGANAIIGDLRATDGTRKNFPYKLSPRP